MTDQFSPTQCLRRGNVAVVTGAASGIGLSAASRFATMGLRVVLADVPGRKLENAAAQIRSLASNGATDVLAVATDVSRSEQLESLCDTVLQCWGPVSVLMNNAGSGRDPGLPWENIADWKSLLDVNLWGVVHGVRAFLPAMIRGQNPALIINTGSKTGFTNPPGSAAYNLSKAALRSYTESLAYSLRETVAGRISAHLLIPGLTRTALTAAWPDLETAWTADQVVDFMLPRVAAGEFYILCPDNAVDREVDARRMRWALDDVILNRPALSRWHALFAEAFAKYNTE
jgi:NAD(P)-dependent dehydrogenase (short-subunit alcohol dehydrogenase family)